MKNPFIAVAASAISLGAGQAGGQEGQEVGFGSGLSRLGSMKSPASAGLSFAKEKSPA